MVHDGVGGAALDQQPAHRLAHCRRLLSQPPHQLGRALRLVLNVDGLRHLGHVHRSWDAQCSCMAWAKRRATTSTQTNVIELPTVLMLAHNRSAPATHRHSAKC